MNAFPSERHQARRNHKEWESSKRKLQSGMFVVVRGHKCHWSTNNSLSSPFSCLLLFNHILIDTFFLKTWNSAVLTSKSINCTFQLVFHTDIVCILVRSKVTYSSRRQTKAVKYHQSHPDHLMRCENIEITTSHVWHCFDSITGKQFTFLLLSYMHRRWKGWLHTGKQTRDMFLFPFLYINSTEKCGLYYIFKHQG